MLLFCKFVVVASLFGALPALAAAQSPLIRYQTESDEFGRKLVFVNNPEIVHAEKGACDIADNVVVGGTRCGRSLFRLENALGAYRNWFEHLNRSGGALSYAVRVRNEGSTCARVTVRGSGISRNGVAEGGREFVELFRAGAKPTVHEVCPGGARVLVGIEGNAAIERWKFFAGVVDFEIAGAPLVLENIAFHKSPVRNPEPLGYVTRVDGRAHESLVYKGVSEHTRAVANGVDFEFNNTTPTGRLNVRYPLYHLPPQSHSFQSEGRCSLDLIPRCTGDVGGYGDVEERDHWVTHIAPDPDDSNPKRANAVVNDIVTLLLPGLPEGCDVGAASATERCFVMSPFYKWHYPDFEAWKYPNWGNWAVHYILRGTLANTGTRLRTVHFGLRADGNSPIAYKAGGSAWKFFPLVKASNNNPDDYFAYGVVHVPPGERVPYQVEYVLSGPAAGTLQNLVKIVN